MDESKFNEKLTDAAKTIFSFCMAKTSNREDAEDLSQDILYELIKSSGSIRDENAFYGFMWAVANNVYNHWYKRKLKNATYELDENMASEDDLFDVEGNSDIYLLRRELTLLSEKYRKATILYYIDGRSCREIAQSLNIMESMVKYLLFKSRKIMKEGMNMERKLGELSYNPKTLHPMYHGQGPNCFYDFMQSKIKQNIVSCCYNDALTAQQISLETGIPLPYLDDEIRALEDKKIIIREGNHYKTNIVIISTECADEIERAATKYHNIIADKMKSFIEEKMADYKAIGFINNDFSENTLRWQLVAILFRKICGVNNQTTYPPKTGWGENAFLWCLEKLPQSYMFNYCGVNSKQGDSIYFFDYLGLENRKGDHHDFYGNERYINIFCDICRDEKKNFSEYDLEAIAEMIKKGYVVKADDSFKTTVPIYTTEQYNQITDSAEQFVCDSLSTIIKEMDDTTARILSSHTPKHLQDQVDGIAATDKFLNAVCIPTTILIHRQFLSTTWHPLEMPTTYVVLNK